MRTGGIHSSNVRGRERLVRDLMLTAGAVAGLCAAPAYAQVADETPAGEAAASEANEDENVIVVSGYRASIEQALEQKREAEAFVDVFTAEDIG